ncbi:MAG: DUF2796 domain-containing protein [Pseudomonadota bacterium]
MGDRHRLAIAASAFAFLVGAPFGAAADHDDEHDHEHAEDHEHGSDSAADDGPKAQRAHVHGAWNLFAALDGDTLTVALSGPLADVAGVEHPEGSPEEAAAIDAVRADVVDADPLVTIAAKAGCALTAPVALAPVILAEGEDDHDHGDHGDHDEDHEHHEDHDHDDDHGHKDDADHDHDHDHDHDDAHHHDDAHDAAAHGADVEFTYAFACKRPDRIDAVSVAAFKTFEGIETVDAVFLGAAAQSAARLTRDAPTLTVD